MFNKDRLPTVIESVFKLSDFGVSGDFNADYGADLAKVGMFVWALTIIF